MMKVAKLLHAKDFHVTFVNTIYNHNRLLRYRGPNALDGLPSFQFEFIPDGSIIGRKEGMNSNEESKENTYLKKKVASISINRASLFFLAHLYTLYQYESYLTKEHLDTKIDWIPSMRNLRLKDIPSFIRTTNPDDIMLNFLVRETDRAKRASAIILNTFDDLEHDVIQSMQSILPPVYSIGPLHLLVQQEIDEDSEIGRMGSNLWREEMEWLDTKSQNSVVYVNFGSITVMTAEQLVEFAWGLAATGKEFFWVIRPDLVVGDVAIVPPEFLTETADRRMLASWCPQEKVLSHPAIGGFLTHNGWNSTLESLCGGVPMVCWPFFAEQQTNCKFCCDEWEIGIEIGGDVKRDEVEAVVRELMDGEKGKKMREKAKEWRRLAEKATEHELGSSVVNLEKLVSNVLIGEQRL
ncbi:unnamed protein product [Microthlaspi erraticum]|uniref:Glycosyltransferase n=1 Tax=Microthlaspi erraticum TaxID=1685480 RepID=A0A6D2K838_9BRAS|nr:unnamed protein product [Microthlaspi erraticum]